MLLSNICSASSGPPFVAIEHVSARRKVVHVINKVPPPPFVLRLILHVVLHVSRSFTRFSFADSACSPSFSCHRSPARCHRRLCIVRRFPHAVLQSPSIVLSPRIVHHRLKSHLRLHHRVLHHYPCSIARYLVQIPPTPSAIFKFRPRLDPARLSAVPVTSPSFLVISQIGSDCPARLVAPTRSSRANISSSVSSSGYQHCSQSQPELVLTGFDDATTHYPDASTRPVSDPRYPRHHQHPNGSIRRCRTRPSLPASNEFRESSWTDSSDLVKSFSVSVPGRCD